MRTIAVITLLFLLFSCGRARPPASVVELEQLASQHISTPVQEQAPGAWEEGMRYLSLARTASDSGDSVQADRFAKLGTLQIKIAIAADRQAKYRKRLEVALQTKQDLLWKKARLKSQLAHLETAIERQRMREHLEMVVDEPLRKAAAQEALTEPDSTQKKQKNGAIARHQVGQEMMARAKIWQSLLQVYVSTGLLEEEQIAFTAREIELAGEKLSGLDMVGLQKNLEAAGVEASRLIDTPWSEKENTRVSLIETVSARLSESGFQVVPETFGPAVSFVISGSNRTGNWPVLVKKLGRILAEIKPVHLVVIGSSGSLGGSKKMLKKSLKRANATAELLAKSGLEKARLHPCGFGGTSPLKSLREGQERVAVLIVPTVPEQ